MYDVYVWFNNILYMILFVWWVHGKNEFVYQEK